MDANDNIEYNHEIVINEINNYLKFSHNLHIRYANYLWKPQNLWKVFSPKFLRDFFKSYKSFNLFAQRNPLFYQNWIKDHTTAEEKESEFFLIYCSDYHLDKLSRYLLKKFPEMDFKKVQEMHRIKKYSLDAFNFENIFGFILAAATLFLKAVPQSVVSRFLPYSKYEWYVFLVTCCLIGYVALVFLPWWFKYRNAKSIYAYSSTVIDYVCNKTPV